MCRGVFREGDVPRSNARTQDGLRAVNEGLAIDATMRRCIILAPLTVASWANPGGEVELLKLMQLSPRDPAMGMSRTVSGPALKWAWGNIGGLSIKCSWRSITAIADCPYSRCRRLCPVGQEQQLEELAEALEADPDLTVKAVPAERCVFRSPSKACGKRGLRAVNSGFLFQLISTSPSPIGYIRCAEELVAIADMADLKALPRPTSLWVHA